MLGAANGDLQLVALFVKLLDQYFDLVSQFERIGGKRDGSNRVLSEPRLNLPGSFNQRVFITRCLEA